MAIIYSIQLYSHCMDNTTVCNDIILYDACFRKVAIKYNNIICMYGLQPI